MRFVRWLPCTGATLGVGVNRNRRKCRAEGESFTNMVLRLVVLSALVLFPSAFAAQSSAAPAKPKADEKSGAAPATPAETSAPAPESLADKGPPGDLVTLKGGRIYRGFQVVRSSSAEVELEVTEDVTIKVPRRQIVSIVFDDIDPGAERQKQKDAEAAAAEATTRLLSGQKVSPAIQTKLGADISDPQINYDKRDLEEAVGELNKHPKIGGLLEIDKPIHNMQPEKRQWTFTSTPGTTLAGLLESMKKSIPGIATVIRNDKLLITDEKSAREIVTTQEPAPAPAPGGKTPPAAPAAGPAPAPEKAASAANK